MIKIGQNILLEISRDGLNAYITLVKDREQDYIESNLMESLSEIKTHITYGLNERLLINILENKIIDEKISIADGMTQVPGKDGSIKYNFDMERPLLPKLKEDGTVDYRELNAINTVKKDDVLAEIIPPIEGIKGSTVTGEEIQSINGRTPKFKYGKNVRISDDGYLLISEANGLVELKNGKVNVSELLEVNTIDSSIGNIIFDGDIIINGDILNGFSVKSTGSIEVKGAVEGGFIECGGEVLIRQGMQGYNKLVIDTKGNLATKFIENAIANVEGNITSEAIMHSNISSNSSILVLGKKGLIVGGICRATYEIRARVIGSTMATTTVIEVGINPTLKITHDELEIDLKRSKENLKKIEQSLKVLEVLKKSNKLDIKKQELYGNLMKAQISLNIEITKTEEEIEKLKIQMGELSRGQVKVADTIYPGVKITIGNSFMFIKDEMKRCTFYREDGEIRVRPY